MLGTAIVGRRSAGLLRLIGWCLSRHWCLLMPLMGGLHRFGMSAMARRCLRHYGRRGRQCDRHYDLISHATQLSKIGLDDVSA